MSRSVLAAGESGEVNVSLVRKDSTGKWKVVTGARRGGDMYRAKLYYRANDETPKDMSRMRVRRGDAVEAVEKAVQEVLRETEFFGPSTPFIAVGNLWLEQIERDGDRLAAQSRYDYAYGFRSYIDQPWSGLQRLSLDQANDPQRIRKCLQIVADERGEATAQKVKTILSNVLQYAIDSGVLKSNATRQLRKARAKVAKPSPWETERSFTDAEVVALMAHVNAPTAPAMPRKNAAVGAVPRVDPRTRATREAVADLLALLLGTGARVGEACSLRWDDLDMETGALLIRKSKTDAGIRRVDLNPELLARLQARAKRTGTKGLIFSAPGRIAADPERAWERGNRDKLLRQSFDAVGLTWAKSHTCRHTVITKLAEAGMPLRRISNMVGHEQTAMTLKYLGKDFGEDKADLAAHLVYA